MTKVAIYCRVNHGSAAYGQFAIERQRKQLMLFAKNNDMRIVGCFSDCGYSGSDLERPGLLNMQKAWKAGRFDAVITVKRDCLYSGNLSNRPQWPFKIYYLTEQKGRLKPSSE